jgi:hypothetical protein
MKISEAFGGISLIYTDKPIIIRNKQRVVQFDVDERVTSSRSSDYVRTGTCELIDKILDDLERKPLIPDFVLVSRPLAVRCHVTITYVRTR